MAQRAGRSSARRDRREHERKRILFVDDDEALLEGLRDALRPQRHRWDVTFARCGADALAMLEHATHDVVVSDLRMPGMDGAELLEAIRDRHPSTVRMVLSGQADAATVTRAAVSAHRLIAKPASVEDLAAAVQHACVLRDRGLRVELDPRTLGVSQLPTRPSIHERLSELLVNRAADVPDIARLVERDLALTAKLLQLANSAYFRLSPSIVRVSDAIACLGLDACRALVLQAEPFGSLEDEARSGFDIEALHVHCGRVARLSSVLAAETGAAPGTFTAALLHDIGLLVLGSQDPQRLSSSLACARATGSPLVDVEREEQGVTHAEIGAHVLSLWGVPADLTRAVARHHDDPGLAISFDGAAVVHLAEALVEEIDSARLPHGLPATPPDLDHLQRVGLLGRLDDWRRIAARQLSEEAA